MGNRFVFFLVLATAILAIAIFLAVSFLTGGSDELDPLDGGEPVVVDPGLPGVDPGVAPLVGVPVQIDNTIVYVDSDPSRSVMLQQQIPAPPAPEVQPTAVPVEPPPTEVLQPTPVPVAPVVLQPGRGVVAGVEPIIFIDYVVTQDDTLYRITQKQTTSIELMAVHGIDAHDLNPGAILRLPVANPAYCAASRPYIIQPGDTIFSIAARLNTTRDTLQQLNNLGPDYRIDIARVLCIP